MKGKFDFQKKWGLVFFVSFLVLCLTQAMGRSAWADQNVTAQILQILKNKGDISAQKYATLKKEMQKKQATSYTTYWHNGLRLQRNDGQFKFHLGGRVQLDWAYTDAGRDLEQSYGKDLTGSGAKFRRVFLDVDGTLYGWIGFKVQVDFAGGKTAFKGVYLDFQKLPVIGKLTVGQFKEPFSLDELTSSNYTTFMERALPVEAFAPGFKTGTMIGSSLWNHRLLWNVGAFYNSDPTDGDSNFGNDSDFDVTMRIGGTPWYMDKTHLLHLGLSYSHKFRSGVIQNTDAQTTFHALPEVSVNKTYLVSTPALTADNLNLIDPAAALVWGPFSLQGEYFRVGTDDAQANDPHFSGYYVFGSWFLTGESRNYSKAKGVFSRIKPRHDFSLKGPGFGAVELAARYSEINLNDEGIQGGKEQNETVGVNWYLNPNTRLMLDYVHAHVDDTTYLDDSGCHDGNSNTVETRFQVNF